MRRLPLRLIHRSIASINSSLLAGVLFAGILATPAHAQAQPPASAATPGAALSALLAKPTSLATVASLVAHAANPAAQARLTEALRDARAPVRAVAARVAFVTASRGLVAAARTALATEQDPEAANEMIRVVVTYGGSDALEDAWKAVDRLTPIPLSALTESLARANRPELFTMLPRIAAAGAYDRYLVGTLLDRTASDPARRKEVIDAIARTNPRSFSLLRAFSARKEAAPPELLTNWLRSTEFDVRNAALWYLVEEIGDRKNMNPLEPLGISIDDWRQSTQGDATWEALAVEVLARAAGRPKIARDWLALRRQPVLTRAELEGPRAIWLTHLEGKELDDLSEAIGGKRQTLKNNLRAAKKGTPAPETPPVRMMPSFAAGLWRDLAALNACDVSQENVFAARVAYKPEGRVRSVALYPSKDTACAAMAGTLFSLALFPQQRPTPADYVETIVLPWHKDIVACADEPTTLLLADEPFTAHEGKTVTPPKKLRHVNPVFPVDVLEARGQGTLTLAGLITRRSGCMRDLTLMTSSGYHMLDLSGLVAVAQWGYTPAMVDGAPVPTIMGVTVHFTIMP